MPLAIVGLSCRLPGADDVEEYWRLLMDGKSAIAEVPPDRFNAGLLYDPKKGTPGKTYTRLGGIVPDRPFDFGSCPIPDALARKSDRSHLTMLEVAAAAVRDAGMDPFALTGRNIGIYIGHSRGSALAGDLIYSTRVVELAQVLKGVEPFDDFTVLLRDKVAAEMVEHVRQTVPHRDVTGGPDVTANAVARLVAQAFGVSGPYQAVDAACASASFALAAGARSLYSGRVEAAIVGSASYSSWFSMVLFSQAQALSATGSFPFDQRADGFISSDGYGAVVLKTLDRALKDGDRVYATIRGIGVSSDGRGRSLWAPRTEGQVAAFERAYPSGFDTSRLQYIEAHGTSTQLGDATEAESMCTVLGRGIKPTHKIPIASVKANIGHTCESAGIAGLIKTVLALKNKVIPPAINFADPSPRIDWDRVPFFVPQRAIEWAAPDSGAPRLAGVNSFGIGGLNAHVAIEDFADASAQSVFLSGSHQQKSPNDALAIIGMGAVFPGARTIDAFETLVESRQRMISDVPPDRWDPCLFYSPQGKSVFQTPACAGGFISGFEYDWRRHKIPPKQLENSDPLHYMLLDAADQALSKAGYNSRPLDRGRTAVIVGTMLANDFFSDLSLALRLPEFEADLSGALTRRGLNKEQVDEVIEEFHRAFEQRNRTLFDETGGFSSSTLASSIAKALDLMGGAFTIDAGEASSLAALAAAEDMLMTGSCEFVLCAGTQRYMGADCYEWYGLRGLLSASSNGNGHSPSSMLPGEGAGMLLLKRLSDAERDSDKILAVIRNLRSNTDTASTPRAIRSAIQKSVSVSKHADPDGIELLGTGLPELDEAATGAFLRTPVLGNSITTQIGHALGASGMANLIKGVVELQSRAQPKGVLSCSFSGLAYYALVTAHRAFDVMEVRTAETWRIIGLSAATDLALARSVRDAAAEAEALFENAQFTHFSNSNPHRMAIVAESPEALRQKLVTAANLIGDPGATEALAREGCFRGSDAGRPRVAFLFAGQGSQYDGMLRQLVQSCSAAAAKVREINDVLASMGHPTFEEIVLRENANLANDVWATQMSVFMADVIVYASLVAQGLRPDVVAGHSFGEYPAMLAAGVWDLEEGLRITDTRCRLIAASTRATGVMMATDASPELVESLCERIDGVVCVANYNAPGQTVVGGEQFAVTEITEKLQLQGYQCRSLPVPRPFHTPLMADVQPPFKKVLEGAKLQLATLPLLSSVTNRYVIDPLEIRDNLVSQMTTPINYVDLIERLRRDGVRAFVEVGPRQVLTNLHRRILTGNPQTVIIASDHPKRPGMEQILRVRAALEAAGWNDDTRRESSQPITQSSPASALPRSPILHFDATERRRRVLKERAETKVRPETRAPEPDASPHDELASFLIDFVCEQTGYPPDLVQLDADLEADLGIDSLKKAQLFGEMRERFDISIESTGRLALDDFPTLRHVLDFLHLQAKTGSIGGARSHHRPSTPAEQAPTIRCVDTAGTEYEMGRRHAREQAELIKDLMRTTSHLSVEPFASDIADCYEQLCLYFTQGGVEELRGMADELTCPLRDFVLYNFRIVGINTCVAAPAGMGCTQLASIASGGEMLHAANEDWPMAIPLGKALPRIAVIRRPTGGIPNLLFGIPGELGGVNGVNARGIAVTSAYLLDRIGEGTAPGLLHTVLVKTILENAADLDSAIDIVRNARRLGAWCICISDARANRLCQIEYDATTVDVRECERAVGANHSTLTAQDGSVPSHSKHRLERLSQLLNARDGWSADAVRSALRDLHDPERQRETPQPTMNTVLRVDNQMSLVMRPSDREVWVTPGPDAWNGAGQYLRLDLNVIFGGSEESDAPHPDAGERVMTRFVLRTKEVPLPRRGLKPLWNGCALVMGSGVTGAALRAHLTQTGAKIVELVTDQGTNTAIERLEELFRQEPVTHLFFTHARTAGAPGGEWREQAVMLPYFLCQRWTTLLSESGLAAHATLAAVTSLGGELGLFGTRGPAEGGALAGLFKCIRREFPEIVIKLVDAPAEEPPASLAAAVCDEIAARMPQLEVGYIHGRRRIVRAVPRVASPVPGRDLRPGSTWVVTGGARGVTALVARELGRRYGLRLHLIGSTPARLGDDYSNLMPEQLRERKLELGRRARSEGRDPAREWSRVEKSMEVRKHLLHLQHEGIHATYHSCDVSNRDELAAVLDRVRRVDGPICGVIHGAGVEIACRYESKQRGNVEATIGAKVDGAGNLISLLEQDPIEWFLAFGSVVARFGGLGQTDYGLASDMLSKQIQNLRARHPDCRAVTFDWPAWDETGMSVRPETKLALEIGKFRFMPVTEGAEFVLDEIRAGGREGEVIILDDARGIDLDQIMPGREERKAFLQARRACESLPLLDGASELESNLRVVAEARFNPDSDVFLHDHKYQGIPLLPSVVGIELMAEAARLLTGSTVTRLRNIEILNPCRFHPGDAQRLEVEAARGENGVKTVLSSEFFNRQGNLVDPRRVYVTGVVELDSERTPETRRLEAIQADWHEFTYPSAEHAVRDNLIEHGPSLRRLQQVAVEADAGWGRIIAPDPNAIGGSRPGEWSIPAAVMDACLVACAVHAHQRLGVRQLPAGFRSIRIAGVPNPGEHCTVQLWLKDRLEDFVTYDFVLYNVEGRPLLIVEGHRSAILTARVG